MAIAKNNPSKKINHTDPTEFHSLSVKEAMQYGIEEAILLNNIRFWLRHNRANKKNIHDDYVWTYNSAQAFSELFPYMNRRSINRYLENLCKKGVLLRGNYNKMGEADRTYWYTIPAEFSIKSRIGQNDQSVGQNDQSVGQNDQSVGQNDQAIPDTNTNTNTDIKHNNNAIPINEPIINNSVLLSLSVLPEKDKNAATYKLSLLSDEQRTLAIDIFTQTVNSGNVTKSPVALINGLIKKGLANELLSSAPIQTPVIAEPIKDIAAIVRKHVENHRNIKALREEFERNNSIFISGHGHVKRDEIKKAGLLELFDEPVINVLKIASNGEKENNLDKARAKLGIRNKRNQNAKKEVVSDESDLFNVQPSNKESKMKEFYNSDLYKKLLEMTLNEKTDVPEYHQIKAECDCQRDVIMSM